jgi:sugar phosphate isomerase/epimerase
MIVQPIIDRRSALRVLATSALVASDRFKSAVSAAEGAKTTGLGLVVYCCGLRRERQRQADPRRDLFEPTMFLAHCRQLGVGGMQVDLGIGEAAQAAALRQQSEAAGVYIEAIISPPRTQGDVDRFQAAMKTAAAAGARAARTVIIPGRRYEYFDSLSQFQEAAQRGQRALELAAPIAEKLRLPLAVENHKDQRNDERVALFKQISSEFVGACVDTGNSLALLEDPLETVEVLAPWAHAVHLKDQAVQLYDDGFLLADVPLGQGSLDLKQMVAILRRHKPTMRFTLEFITRDPLKVPVLTEKYWATFPELPASVLARALRRARNGSAMKLQYVTPLSPDDQVALEDANVRSSLDYARDQLRL